MLNSKGDLQPSANANSKWNITNSAQNIVSALVDPSKQDHAFKREWASIFSRSSSSSASGSGRGYIQTKSNQISTSKEVEKLVKKLSIYQAKLDERRLVNTQQNELERAMRGFADTGANNSGDSNDTNKRGLHQVPKIFTQESFDLSDVKTFNEVLSIATSNRQNSEDSEKLSESHLRQIQRDLTDYLDIIEETLAGQISNRSGDFFQVMSSVDSVMDQMSLAIKSVTSLRQQCASLNNALIKPHLRNIQLTKSRSNAQKVLQVLDSISNLTKTQSEIQLALSSSDFVGALELIAKTRRALATDLVAVVCLRHLEVRLNEIERLIGTLMQKRLTRMISERSRTKKL